MELAAAAGIDKRAAFAGNRAVGRVALTVAHDGLRSARTRLYEDGPLRLRFPRSDVLEAVLINTAGGVAGGDRLALDIDIGARAELTLTTAAAEKVYRALDEDARITINLNLRDGGKLHWLPQETILFDNACLERNITIDVASDAQLLLAEAVVFGRAAMGESVAQGRLIDRWRVRRAGELVFADTVRLDGAVAEFLRHPAVAAGGGAVGTLLAMPADVQALDRARKLSLHAEVGISAWNGFLLARLVATDGEKLRRDLAALVTGLGAPLPRLWLN
jgi:urease accessory protein